MKANHLLENPGPNSKSNGSLTRYNPTSRITRKILSKNNSAQSFFSDAEGDPFNRRRSLSKKRAKDVSKERYSELDELSEIGDFNRKLSVGRRSIENLKIE